MELTLNLTHACNLGCSYCFAGEKSARAMTFETGRDALLLALDEVQDDKLNVAFFGGEPLIEFDLLLSLADEALKLTEARGVRCGFSVTTNGTLLTVERADALEARRFHVGISADGGPAAQDATRPYAGGRSSAASLDAGITAAVQRLTKLSAIAVVDPLNVRYLADSVRSLVEKGFRRITLNGNWLADWSEEHLELWRSGYEAIARFWQERMREGRPFNLSTIDPKIWRRLTGLQGEGGAGCGYGDREIAVAPSGRIYPCGRVIGEDPEDPDSERRGHCVGHVEGGISEGGSCGVQESALPAECQVCVFRSRCTHSCGCSNVEATGDANTPGAVLCWHEKMSIRLADQAASELYAEWDRTFMARFYFEAGPAPTQRGTDHAPTASRKRERRGRRRHLPVA